MYKPIYNLDGILGLYKGFSNLKFSYSAKGNNQDNGLSDFSSYRTTNHYYRDLNLDDNYSKPIWNTEVVYENDLSIFITNDFNDLELRDDEIRSAARDLFVLATGKEFDSETCINIYTPEEFKKLQIMLGIIGNDVQGFCINNNKEVFVKRQEIGMTLIVIGHELGHIFTKGLNSKHCEEAKAFAFSIEWIKKIKQENVFGLKDSLTLDFKPAINGLHNIAFDLVLSNIKEGKSAMQIYWELVYNVLEL